MTACLASLLAVLFALAAAGRETGAHRLGLIAGATFTVVVSWMVINMIFTLRYADLHYRAVHGDGGGVDFGTSERQPRRTPGPTFATSPMSRSPSACATRCRTPTCAAASLRRTVLAHAVISYVFGVVIVAAGINLVAGLIQ